jgi:hypothetical protein
LQEAQFVFYSFYLGSGGCDVNAELKAILEGWTDFLSGFLFVGVSDGHVAGCEG